jgi:hypothetical protein
MADDHVRVEIGFEGGQIVASFVDPSSADQLEQALHKDGPRVVVLETEDGPLHVIVPQVVYFKRVIRAGRVGFGSG